jgi:6-phosphogluconolactonase (cycloisomerase 2 family)
MAISKFNARHGLSVGSNPIDVIGDDGAVSASALVSRSSQSSQSIVTGIFLQSSYSSTGVLSAISSFASTGNQPAGLAVHPTGKFAYVANYGTVSQFSLNQTTGVPTSITTAIASNAGTGCSGIAVDPTGKYLYVTNYEVNTVSQFSINQTTGALTVITTAVGSGTFPFDIAVDPSGKYAYVANQSAGTVSQYSISLNGGLSNLFGTVSASAISTGASTTPSGIAVDPTGRFAYVGTYTGNSIAQFSINQTTGALTSIGTSIATGASSNPTGIAVDPTGKFVYVVLEGNGTLAQYSINQITGVLTSISTPIATGSSPKKVVVDPTGRFAYVSNYGGTTVSQYSINQTTGALTSITTAITTGSGPIGIAVDPTGRFVYTASAGGTASINLHTINNFSVGQSTVNSSSLLKSTSTATGALVVTGGVGISENLYLGGNLNLGGTITGNNSGTLVLNTAFSNTVTPSISITAGDANGTGLNGGSINITAGNSGSQDGGNVNILAGTLGGNGSPGNVNITGGGGGGDQNTVGGAVIINGGTGYGNGTGPVSIGTIAAGANTNSTTAGDVGINAGYADPNNARINLNGQNGNLTISGVQITLTSKVTAGTIDNMSIGATTASTGRFTNASITDTTASTTTTTGALKVSGGVGIAGNLNIGGSLVVNGTTTTINSNTLTVDDKNIELGAVTAIGPTATLTAGSSIITGLSSTANLIPGQKIGGYASAGTVTVTGSVYIVSIDSPTQITLSAPLTGTGSVIGATLVFNGATDLTANGGGITLKGATDKSIIWDSTNSNWTSSEHWNIASDKSFKINNTSVLSSDTLGSGVTKSSITKLGTVAGLVKSDSLGNLSSDTASYLTSETTLALLTPIVLDDVSPQADSVKSVFTLRQNATALSNIYITDSKDLQVTVDGRRLQPYTEHRNFVFMPVYDAYRGFRVRGNRVIIYNAPEVGSQITLVVQKTSSTKQIRRYPFSATTIVGD